jgi:hypothetical protein
MATAESEPLAVIWTIGHGDFIAWMRCVTFWALAGGAAQRRNNT